MYWRRLAGVGVAAAVVFGVVAALPAEVGTPPVQARAVQFTESGGFLEIRIKDPAADPERYRREIAERGLDITLKLAPAPAEQVGRVIFTEESVPGVRALETPGHCTANGNCSVGIRVPLTYRGTAVIVFGRQAGPGEEVEGGDTGLARRMIGKTVGEVRAGGKSLAYRSVPGAADLPAAAVPDDWFVLDAATGTGGLLIIWVSADRDYTAPPRTR
ncbi:hypothetical protein [Paractinoplanes rishiriensis]|uniref:Uncharacterized protein n=1 Tax=Paractinoplanes rishiriensis TaxID=1050105 RepID=A0A919K0G7_9ACTN|nr:hypothetical protein [Actinoplanes rishiriensis]GIE97124.1 hypothetical protein Ari01nite_45890 [Actinoplanes rishiriensis]